MFLKFAPEGLRRTSKHRIKNDRRLEKVEVNGHKGQLGQVILNLVNKLLMPSPYKTTNGFKSKSKKADNKNQVVISVT